MGADLVASTGGDADSEQAGRTGCFPMECAGQDFHLGRGRFPLLLNGAWRGAAFDPGDAGMDGAASWRPKSVSEHNIVSLHASAA
mmetsp:Transcript_60957/g.142002  ORF Transcript_60957/g.142002 Transcript_60957/m.142002 type:complete len:85 (-) Transcript_60957:1869-2123(-)